MWMKNVIECIRRPVHMGLYPNGDMLSYTQSNNARKIVTDYEVL